MKQRLGALGLFLLVALISTSCSKKKEETSSTTPSTDLPPAGMTANTDTSPSFTVTQLPPEGTPATPGATPATGDNVGSYAKLDMASLSPEQKDKAMKRMLAENCTCGCVGDTIDRCLRNDPACGVAVTLAMQVIDEVKAGK